MDSLFYKDKDQLVLGLDKMLSKIVDKKQPNKSMMSSYRDFCYKEETSRHVFKNEPQPVNDFIEEYVSFFDNSINFDCPSTLYNVHPNVNIYGQLASFVASVISNPNFCMDLPSGKLLSIEKLVVEYMCNLAKWGTHDAGGIFTFGGKGTLLYALKEALSKLDPEYRVQGVHGDNYIISNDLGHPAHIEICNWLGIGEKSCIRLKTYNGVVRPKDIESRMIQIIESGGNVPLIILNSMTTNNHTFDDIKAVYDIRNKLVKKYKLTYKPHIHIDSVLGWIYLLLGAYDYKNNPAKIKPDILNIIYKKAQKAKSIKYADSFAADFHKTGFCAYVSSVYLTKNKNGLFGIESKYTEDEGVVFSEYAPYDFSLESSRSPHGPISAFATLKTMGVNGFMSIIANQTEGYLRLKNKLSKLSDCVVCNIDEESNLIFVMFLPGKYKGIKIDNNTPDQVAEEIKRYNLKFYSFFIEKSKKEKPELFFSCSRSYKYHDKSYGCLKLYNFNSHFNSDSADKVFTILINLYKEYTRVAKDEITDHKSFDFAEIKNAE